MIIKNGYSFVILLVVILILLTQLTESARKMGGRRKSSRKQKQSTRLIALSPKLKAYYESENVSLTFLLSANYIFFTSHSLTTNNGREPK